MRVICSAGWSSHRFSPWERRYLEPLLSRGALYGVFTFVGFILLSTASTLGSGVAEHYTRQAEPGISQVSSPGTLTILNYWHTLRHTHPDILLTLAFPRNFPPGNTMFPSHTDTDVLIQTLLAHTLNFILRGDQSHLVHLPTLLQTATPPPPQLAHPVTHSVWEAQAEIRFTPERPGKCLRPLFTIGLKFSTIRTFTKYLTVFVLGLGTQ